jgi:tetratricopeptide (TPR) repeat protein
LYWLEISLASGGILALLVIAALVGIAVILLKTPKDTVASILRAPSPTGGTATDDASDARALNFAEHIHQGNTFLGQYNYDQALKHFQAALKLKNNDPAVHFKIGRIFLQKEDLRNATAAFQNTLTLNPEQIEAYYELARIHQHQGHMEEAHQMLDKALAMNATHEDVLKLKVKLLELQGHYEQAIPFLQTLVDTTRNSQKYQAQIADFLCKAGNEAAAIAEYQRLASSDPEHQVKYHAKIGQAYFEQGDYGSAIDYFKRVLQEQGTLHDMETLMQVRNQMAAALCNRGVELFEKNEFQNAILSYQEALMYDDANADIHYNLGKALSRRNETMKAIQHFQRAIALSPNDVSSYYEMAILQDEKGMIPDAIGSYEKVLELDPKNVNASFGLGTLYGVQNNLEKSIQFLSAAVYLNPKFVDAIFNLGVALERKKEFNKAMQMYKKALSIDPAYEKARSNLAHIKHTQKL